MQPDRFPTPRPRVGHRQLHARVRQAHHRLLSVAELLAHRDVIEPRRLHLMWRIQGYRVVARSTLALASLLRAEWGVVGPTGLLGIDAIEESERLAGELAQVARKPGELRRSA